MVLRPQIRENGTEHPPRVDVQVLVSRAPSQAHRRCGAECILTAVSIPRPRRALSVSIASPNRSSASSPTAAPGRTDASKVVSDREKSVLAAIADSEVAPHIWSNRDKARAQAILARVRQLEPRDFGPIREARVRKVWIRLRGVAGGCKRRPPARGRGPSEPRRHWRPASRGPPLARCPPLPAPPDTLRARGPGRPSPAHSPSRRTADPDGLACPSGSPPRRARRQASAGR